MPEDQFDQLEENLKMAEKNIESVFKIFGKLIYKLFYLAAGGIEHVVLMFGKGGKKDDFESSF